MAKNTKPSNIFKITWLILWLTLIAVFVVLPQMQGNIFSLATTALLCTLLGITSLFLTIALNGMTASKEKSDK